jgi:tRNA modification GTPase
VSGAPALGGGDTIAAIATARGRSALSIVRLSGADAVAIAGRLIPSGWPAEERAASLRAVHAPDGSPIDHAIVTRFAAPRSFTGEDLVEICCHGGALIPALVLDALLAAGARVALPGEFTRRAVLNGRIDLLQAEAIGDLIEARSRAAHRAALDQLDRGLSQRVAALRESFLALEALIAYDIDFPEEDDGPIPRARIEAAAAELAAALDNLLATSRAGELVREGALVVIAGSPNVGKSSLFNALLGRRRAIVTDVPGTTRDAIEAVVDTGRWALRLVDTAGMRDTTDTVERLGIEVSEQYIDGADIVLACGETDEQIEDAAGYATSRSRGTLVKVRTKSDVIAGAGERAAGVPPEETSGRRHNAAALPPEVIATSAETGAGLGQLLQRIDEALDARTTGFEPDTPLLVHERHARAMAAAREEVRAFAEAWGTGSVPAPVAAVHLREGARLMEELIGAVDVEDILGRVFADYCVGK